MAKNRLTETEPPPKNNHALVEVARPSASVGWSTVRNFAEAMQVGEVIYKSNAVEGIRNAAQAVVKIMAGMELGFGAMASVMNVHFIDGKPSIGAALRSALVKASDKYDYELLANDDAVCEIAFYERSLISGGETRKRCVGWVKKPHHIRITLQQAQEKGWTVSRGGKDKGNWVKVPADMLFARALSRGQRQHCPDLTGGLVLYDADELDNGSTPAPAPQPAGEVIDASYTVSEPGKPDVVVSDTVTTQYASEHQVARIGELIDICGFTPEQWRAAFIARGVTNARELTVDQASEIIRKLEKLPAKAVAAG